jgi:hypothetical protein
MEYTFIHGHPDDIVQDLIMLKLMEPIVAIDPMEG